MSCKWSKNIAQTKQHQAGLGQHLPSIKLHLYSADDVKNLETSIPSTIEPVDGTMKFHEVIARTIGTETKLLYKNRSCDLEKEFKLRHYKQQKRAVGETSETGKKNSRRILSNRSDCGRDMFWSLIVANINNNQLLPQCC